MCRSSSSTVSREAGQQLWLSGKTTLRQGGKMQGMKALLYIPGDRSTGGHAYRGQVNSLTRHHGTHGVTS